jgi:hypothetical protein
MNKASISLNYEHDLSLMNKSLAAIRWQRYTYYNKPNQREVRCHIVT